MVGVLEIVEVKIGDRVVLSTVFCFLLVFVGFLILEFCSLKMLYPCEDGVSSF